MKMPNGKPITPGTWECVQGPEPGLWALGRWFVCMCFRLHPLSPTPCLRAPLPASFHVYTERVPNTVSVLVPFLTQTPGLIPRHLSSGIFLRTCLLSVGETSVLPTFFCEHATTRLEGSGLSSTCCPSLLPPTFNQPTSPLETFFFFF